MSDDPDNDDFADFFQHNADRSAWRDCWSDWLIIGLSLLALLAGAVAGLWPLP